MQGRFSNPVPARLPGGPLQTYQVPVAVSGANVSTRIVAAGTPYRRFPY
jgi:hypothetical protein